MQFYTVAGAIIVSACGLEGARRLNRSAESNVSGVGAYLSFLRYVRSQIDCYALPICEIFERCSRELLFSCGWRCEEAPKSFEELFSCARITDKEAKNIISEFCSDFGRNYREEELKRCDFCITALEKCRERLAAEVPNKKKLNLTLCLSSALAIIILLV